MTIHLDRKRVIVISGRATLFLFAASLLLLTLFLLSNYQQFLDHNQKLIMNLLSAALVLHLASGLFHLFLPVLLKDFSLLPRRGRIAFVIVSLAFSFVLFLILEFFYAWISF